QPDPARPVQRPALRLTGIPVEPAGPRRPHLRYPRKRGAEMGRIDDGTGRVLHRPTVRDGSPLPGRDQTDQEPPGPKPHVGPRPSHNPLRNPTTTDAKPVNNLHPVRVEKSHSGG